MPGQDELKRKGQGHLGHSEFLPYLLLVFGGLCRGAAVIRSVDLLVRVSFSLEILCINH